MALFKQMRGNRASLDSQPLTDGYAYFCIDDGTFHIDFKDTNGVIQRKQINAQDAETLCGKSLAEIKVEIMDDIEIPEVNLSEYAKKSDIPDTSKFITSIPGEYVTETELTAKNYALKSEIPAVPVQSVNNKTGAVTLTATDVGADASGTASSAVSTHNSSTSAHADIRTAVESKANKSEGAFFIEGSGTTDSTAKTSTWVGTSDRITEYYDGLTIRYKIGVAGQTTTTLNVNGLGAKPIYLYNTTKLTTQFPVNSIINLIYHADLNSGCWMCSDYDSNTNTYQRVYPTTTNTEYPITARYNTTTGSSYYAEYGRYSTGVTLNPSTNTITATKFKGALTGNADTATKATQDASGNVITSTYETKADATTKINNINSQISQLSSEIADIKSEGAQQTPLFANDVSECTDTSKLYLLPNGNIWAYTKGLTENKVNQYNPNTAKFNYRLHHDYIGTANDPWRTGKGWLYVEIDGIDLTGKTSYIIRISGVEIIRHSFGATGGVSFFNQSTSTTFDLTGHTKSAYIDIQGSLQFKQDDEGYYFDLMDANPAADTVRCILGIVLANNVSISAADCENLFIEAVPLTTYTTEYSWRDTGLAYANYVLTDSDTTIIAEKVDKKINSIMYVDGETGSNSNTGSQDDPLKTIQKAIDSGAKTIYCKAGTYNENITLNNIHGVKIIGQWETYENGKRPKVRIDHSTTLIPSNNENGLKTVALPVDTYKYVHPLLYQVFVTKTLSPTMGNGITIGYVVSLWNVTDEQVSTHYKLVPVMTLDECRSTEETFFYDGATLYIHSTGSTFRMVSSNKHNKVENCSDVVFEDIAFDYCYYDALSVNNSNGVIFRNCEFSHSSTACGVATTNMNGEFYNCEAYCNRLDGFNFHEFGETTVYNCIGAYNYDDGISHHDGCTGSIHGGLYHHNGKGGVSSPTYGAVIDIYNVISHNNQYGIYAVGGSADRQIIVNGCYIHHNTYGIASTTYELLVINSTITDNSTKTSGSVTVIAPVYP